MADGPRWDGKIYKRAKFGDPFHWRTVKGHQRAVQIAERRRRDAEARNADELDRLEWAFRPWPVKVLATTVDGFGFGVSLAGAVVGAVISQRG